MDEFISREATIKRIKEVYCVSCNSYHGVRCRACGTGDAIDMIEDAPAADVAPVRHGRWVSVAGKRDRICSRCLRNEPYKNADDDAEVFEFCPHCGAKMDGGDSDEVD